MPISSYAIFEQKVQNLRAYLYVSSKMRGVVLSHVPLSEPTILEFELGEAQNRSPDSIRWRVMEHTLAVGHLYALYESYCEELVRDWVQFLTPRFKFAKLPVSLIKGY